MYRTNKRFYYYFSNGEIVITAKSLSIIDIAEYEAKLGILYFSEYC